MVSVNDYKSDFEAGKVVQLNHTFGLIFSTAGGASLVTYHPITNGVLGLGKPIDVQAAASAVEAFAADATGTVIQSPWVDRDVIYSDSELFIFRTPKNTPKTLWFRVQGIKEAVKVEALLPTIVYVYSRSSRHLKVFAALTNDVAADTPLYHAPFCNVASTGSLCVGSAELPKVGASDDEIKVGIQNCLFDSLFTHISHTKTFKGAKDNLSHVKAWQALAESKKVPTSKHLNKFGSTLSKIVEK